MSTTTSFDSMGSGDEYQQSAEGLVRRYGQIDYRMLITSIKAPDETYNLICDIDKARGNMATLYKIVESFATRENK